MKQHSCFKQIMIGNVSCTANQHIRLISEGSCDTEAWSNDAENAVFCSNYCIFDQITDF